MYIEVDKNDLRLVQKKFKDLKSAGKHLKNAINRTVTQAMKMLREGRSKGYTVKAERFNKAIDVQRANVAHLDATIRASGKPPTLMSFKTTFPKAGGRTDITKTGLKKLVTATGGAAFIAQGGKAKGLMVQRKGSDKYPIKVLYGNSVPKMVEKIYEGERGGQGDMEGTIRKRLHDEIRSEIERIM